MRIKQLHFFPSEIVVFRTKLKEDEILFRLVKNTGGLKSLFEGEINTNDFNIKRSITYRNNFLPEIKGSIKTDAHGTIIVVGIQAPNYISVIMSIFILTAAVFCVHALYIIISKKTFELPLLFPFVMVFVGYIFSMIYTSERDKSKEDLRKLFDAEIII